MSDRAIVLSSQLDLSTTTGELKRELEINKIERKRDESWPLLVTLGF